MELYNKNTPVQCEKTTQRTLTHLFYYQASIETHRKTQMQFISRQISKGCCM